MNQSLTRPGATGFCRKRSAFCSKSSARCVPRLDLQPDYAWAGTFAETEDGLPYIGEASDYPGCHFALGYGGNGITFSLIAAQLISRAISGYDEHSDDARPFRFGR